MQSSNTLFHKIFLSFLSCKLQMAPHVCIWNGSKQEKVSSLCVRPAETATLFFFVLFVLLVPLLCAALVPDSVKKELLQRIRAFLAQHATLWMRRFPSRHFFTHRRSTIKFQTLFSLWAMLKCYFLFCIVCFHIDF